MSSAIIKDMKTTINKIQKAVDELKASGINRNALYALIQRSAGSRPERMKSGPIPMAIVRAVCEGIEDLKDYVFPPED